LGRLIEDYRLMAAMGVYIATEYCRGGVFPVVELRAVTLQPRADRL
jgi:hypothetical protein